MSDFALSAGHAAMAVVEKIYHSSRLFEWVTAGMMLTFFVILSIWPQSANNSSLRIIIAAGFAEPYLRLSFFIGGVMRCAALVANGHWQPVGPWLRACGALGGAVLWASMGWALVPSLGSDSENAILLGVFAWLFLGEIASCHRSLAHGRWRG